MTDSPTAPRHLTAAELESGWEAIRQSPRDVGTVKLIVRRPLVESREVLEVGEFDIEQGLVGDGWRERDGRFESQITLMNSRAAELLAQSDDRWALAGDQLFVDLDLSDDNLRAGDSLTLGSVVLEVTPEPHTGCRKFSARFGPDALRFVNSPAGRHAHLRGIYAKVVQSGTVKTGEEIRVERVGRE